MRFDGIEVVLTLDEQAQVAPDDVAVVDAANANREALIDQFADAQALDVLPDQGHAGVGGQ